jgi:hypothetical protein
MAPLFLHLVYCAVLFSEKFMRSAIIFIILTAIGALQMKSSVNLRQPSFAVDLKHKRLLGFTGSKTADGLSGRVLALFTG